MFSRQLSVIAFQTTDVVWDVGFETSALSEVPAECQSKALVIVLFDKHMGVYTCDSPHTGSFLFVNCLLWARRAYIGNTLQGKNGLHAFGNNSAESEPI